MTQSPVRIVIAVILIILLMRNLYIFFMDVIVHSGVDLSSETSVAEAMGYLIFNGFMMFVIFLLLKDNRKKSGK